MTFSTLLPYLLVAGGYLLRHYNVLGSLLGILHNFAGPNPLAPPSQPAAPPLTLPPIRLGNHPILSDAVQAAIRTAVNDVVSGHITSLRDEIKSAAAAAVAAALADLKPKS